MNTGTAGDEGAEVRAALTRCTEGIPADIGVRVRARKYRVNPRRVPFVTSTAAVVIAALIFSLVTVTAGPSTSGKWELVSYVGTPAWQAAKGQNLHTANDLECPTVSSCYAIVPGPDEGPTTIEYTHDAGSTWHESTLPGNTTFTVETLGSDQLACFGNDNCSTMGHNNGGLVFVTTHNGGRTWTLIREPRPLHSTQPITGYACATATTCVGVAPQVAFTTTTGWKTWSRHALPDGFSPFSVSCSAPAYCVALGYVGNASAAFVSRDGGGAWTRSSGAVWSSQVMTCSGAACMNVIHVDPTFGSRTGVSISTDYGRVWKNATGTGFIVEPQNVACATATTCWASGQGTVYPGPGEEATKFELVSTSNQGQSWQEYNFPLSTHILQIGPLSCPTATTCYAVAYKTGNDSPPVLLRNNS